MDWVQVFAIVFSVFGLFLWARAEGNADRKETQAILREDRKDFISLINEIKNEMKDFHYRLLEIEKRKIGE